MKSRPRDIAVEVEKHFLGDATVRVVLALHLGAEAVEILPHTHEPQLSVEEARAILRRNNRGAGDR